MQNKQKQQHKNHLYAQTPFWVIALALVLPSPAFAVNECGVTANGGTATCTGDGVPAADTSPYAAGITYTNPVNLVVDGTTTPLTVNGRIGVTSNAGPQSTTIIGDVSIVRTGNVPMITVGDYTTHSRSMSLYLGEDVDIDLTRTSANGNLYAIAALSTTGQISVESHADLLINHTGGGADGYIYGILANVSNGGVSSSASIDMSGDIEINMNSGYYLQGVYVGATGSGSSALVSLDSSADIRLQANSGAVSLCYGMGTANTGTGGTRLVSSGNLRISGNCSSYGIGLTTNSSNDAYIENTGTVDVNSSAGSAYAITTDSIGHTSTVRILNDMTATAGYEAVGLFVSGTSGSYDIEVASDVSVSAHGDVGSWGIYAAAANGGTITVGENASILALGGNKYAIETADGADVIASRGHLGGDVITGAGNDSLELDGGTLDGGVDMGADDDILTIRNIDRVDLQTVTHLLGGTGTDELTLDGLTLQGHSMPADDILTGINFGDGWETINLINGSAFTLTGNLVLGGSTVNIDSTSTLYAGNGLNSIIESVLPGDPAIVINEGVIDLTNGLSGPTDTLTIRGNYIGNGGTILMDVVLGDSASPTDRIILDGSNGGGTATGSTTILINNAGGLGAPTTGNGILLVETINGATVAPDAFTLASRASAGAYDYELLLAPDNSFYLAAAPGARAEVAVNGILPDLTHKIGLQMLGTYDQRTPLRMDNGRYHGWGRGFALDSSRNGGGSFQAHGAGYDSDMTGVQTGVDLWHDPANLKTRNIAGVYVGVAKLDAGAQLATGGGHSGSAEMTGYSLGAYWTRHHDAGFYTDAVLQGTYYDDVSTFSATGESFRTKGLGAAASIEVGKPLAAENGLTVTPQVQAIYQAVKLKDGQDNFGQIDYDTADAIHARAGVKLSKSLSLPGGTSADIWLTPNVWHSLSAKSTAGFSTLAGTNRTTFDSDLGGSRGQLDFGVAGKLSQNVSLYAAGDYSVGFNRDGHSLGGRVGLKVTW